MNINRSAVYYYLLVFGNLFLGRQNIIESFWYTISIYWIRIYTQTLKIYSTLEANVGHT